MASALYGCAMPYDLAAAHAHASPTTKAVRTLRVAASGAWFEWASGASESGPGFFTFSGEMERKPVAWGAGARILARLARHASSASAELVTVDDLAAAGWPDEKGRPISMRTRVYQEIHRLRALGLHIERVTPATRGRFGGYRLPAGTTIDNDLPFRS